MLGNRLTLRSRLPELVKQELWGILLTYNLVRYQMVKMCHYLQGDYLPYQLSFNGALAHIMRLLVGLPYSTPGAIPRQLKYFYEMTESLDDPGLFLGQSSAGLRDMPEIKNASKLNLPALAPIERFFVRRIMFLT